MDLILYQAIQDRASDIHRAVRNEFKSPSRRWRALRNVATAAPVAAGDFARESHGEHEHCRKTPAARWSEEQIAGRALICSFNLTDAIRRKSRAGAGSQHRQSGSRSARQPDYIYNFLLEMIERRRHFHRNRADRLVKTTTLLLFAQVNTIDSKLITAEEPVEYDLKASFRCR